MASLTGTYVWRNGELVKVSDRTRPIRTCYVPDGGYYDEHLGAYITTREQKHILMKQHGVVPDDDMSWREPKRTIISDPKGRTMTVRKQGQA